MTQDEKAELAEAFKQVQAALMVVLDALPTDDAGIDALAAQLADARDRIADLLGEDCPQVDDQGCLRR